MTRFENVSPAARATLVVVGLLVLLLLAGTSTAMIALAGVGRLSPDVEPARVPAWLWHYRADPNLERWLRIGGLISILLAVVIVSAVALGIRRPLHGAAHWASTRDLKAAGLAAREGILLGRRGRSWLIAGGSEHVMLYAPTRTGKGVGIVIPNLLTWPGSVVVLDIKRENHSATAGFRAAAGQTVLLFDPLAPDGRTARFNPLAHITRSSASAVLDELQRMAVMLFPGHDHADPFWSEAARTGFIGVGAYVAETPDLPFSLGEIFRQLTHGDAREKFPGLIKARTLAGTPLSTGCTSALTDFCSSSENTFASVRQTITSRMGLWLNPAVDAATAVSDFDLRDLRRGGLSLYLGASPDNMLRVAPLYSLLFQQLVDLNSRRLPGPDDRPVLVLLDEFARLGRAPILAAAFSYLAGYGFRLLPVIQSPSQLRALYGPDVTEDILTNCGIEVVFAPKELKVAQELSERLGYYTYHARSQSRPMGLGSGRRSTTTSDQRRALMMPQELMQLPDRTLIVLKAGMPPARGEKIRFFRERVFTRRQRPPPTQAKPPAAPTVAGVAMPTLPPPLEDAEMTYEAVIQAFTEQGCPPPEIGATENEVADWLDQIIDVVVNAPDRDGGR
ncbi:MAG: type IV secretory system conjugative DNA transfer family protein [Brevundimonas sp.]|nr:MAG: type IV secretory system conjugative DNA transfer family protein [Brevundimonas sp.]